MLRALGPWCALAWVLAVAGVGWVLTAAGAASADEVGTALYVRNDTNATTVISPRARVRTTLGTSTQAEVSYAIDIWTSASVDIVTAASLSVTEQRDEINANVSHELTDLTLTAGYRYSTENDYESHTGSASFTLDMADNNTTLAGSGYFGSDVVGRAGDPGFARPLNSFGGRLSLTQVLDPQTVILGTYEAGYMSGYQASPYPFVGFGGDGYGCRGAFLCLPERVPETRLRHALVVEGRRALSESLSIGGGYRFYIDGWGLMAHTLQAMFAWLPDSDTQLSLKGRLYTQGAASFYRSRYGVGADQDATYTRDRELSPLSSYKLGAELTRSFEVGSEGILLRAALAAAITRYDYRDFVGLTSVDAFEITAAITVDL